MNPKQAGSMMLAVGGVMILTFGDEETQSISDNHSHSESEPELVYSSAVEFFVELLAQSYVREVNEGAAFAWCPEWYKHPEALIRMESICRA